MLFGCTNYIEKNSHKIYSERKESLSPQKNPGMVKHLPKDKTRCKRRVSFFASLRASLTVEAAMVLPIFFICMTAFIHMGTVMETAARFGSALCETSEKMAVSAYAREYGETSDLLTGGLSAIYARGSVMKKAGDTSAVKNANFLLSTFLQENDMIHVVMTYQVKTPVGGIKLPGVYFLQRGSVRGWTGRAGSGGTGDEDTDGQQGTRVYVTEHGTVYHKDSMCSHIKLSIKMVKRNALGTMRNKYGEKYRCCEKCGSRAGSNVYITTDGNCYHSSLECSGLKRTVKEVSLEELGNMKPCSKCGQH